MALEVEKGDAKVVGERIKAEDEDGWTQRATKKREAGAERTKGFDGCCFLQPETEQLRSVAWGVDITPAANHDTGAFYSGLLDDRSSSGSLFHSTTPATTSHASEQRQEDRDRARVDKKHGYAFEATTYFHPYPSSTPCC